jgi:Kef-type K+ transport system membrane component KefB
LQVGLTIAATAVAAILFGRELNQAIFFGFLVALSSTAIVLKSYAERNEVDAPHGRAAVGILIFQDISIVLMMLLGSGFGRKRCRFIRRDCRQTRRFFAGFDCDCAAAWLLVPLLLKKIVRLKSPEVLLLLVVLVCLGISFVTAQFGLSLALGAFIAGMVLADSDYSHQVTADILPFRDVFNSIFFVSIGMLLSVGALFENLSTVFLVGAAARRRQGFNRLERHSVIGLSAANRGDDRARSGANRRIFLCAGKSRTQRGFASRRRLSKFSRRFDYLDDCHAVYDRRRAAFRLFRSINRAG